MLSDQQKELLSAYVDGELQGHERKLAVRLLRQSPAARKLFRDLQKDSRLLAALPRQSPPPELAQHVLAQLPAGVPATPSTLVRETERVPSWLGMVLAASILFVVTLASYFYFADRPNPIQPGPIVENKQPDEVKPQQPIVPPPLLQFALKDFNKKADVQKQLAKELESDTSLQIDLTTRSNGEAVKNLQKVFKDNSITLLLDTRAQDLMKEGKKTKFLLFVEDLQPAQVAKIFNELARQQQPATPAVETVTLNQVSMDRRLEVAALLGLSLEDLQPAKKSTRPKIDVTQFQDLTLIQDPKAKGQPKVNPQAPPPGPQSMAVMLAYDAEAQSSSSDAIKNFIKARNAIRPEGTLQLVVILNEAAV